MALEDDPLPLVVDTATDAEFGVLLCPSARVISVAVLNHVSAMCLPGMAASIGSSEICFEKDGTCKCNWLAQAKHSTGLPDHLRTSRVL